MEAIKKYWLWGIFISILSIFAMSHNASAIDAIFDVSNYDLVQQRIYMNQNCTYNDNITQQSVYLCGLNGTRYQLKQLDIAPSANNFEIGDIVQFDLLAYGNSTVFTVGETASGSYSLPFEYPFINGSQDYYILGIDQLQFQDNETLINYYSQFSCRTQGTGQFCDGYPELTNVHKYYQAYRITLKMRVKMINSTLSLVSTTVPILQLNGYNLSNVNVDIRLTRFNVWRPIETQENKEQEQKTQEAADASEVAGGDSSSDAQTGTTSLINAITGAVSVISLASPTNCKINGNMGNLNIGQIDLCANPAPAFVQTIGSLILILAIVPLAITLFNRFISLFRSFQS